MKPIISIKRSYLFKRSNWRIEQSYQLLRWGWNYLVTQLMNAIYKYNVNENIEKIFVPRKLCKLFLCQPKPLDACLFRSWNRNGGCTVSKIMRFWCSCCVWPFYCDGNEKLDDLNTQPIRIKNILFCQSATLNEKVRNRSFSSRKTA